MSGILRPPSIPETEIKRSPEWLGFFKRLIARKPQLDELHLLAAAPIYLGDAATNGSWRIIRSGDDLHFDRREAGSWVNKGSFTAV